MAELLKLLIITIYCFVLVDGQEFRDSTDNSFQRENVDAILNKNALKKFTSILRSIRLYQVFLEKENFTVFAPSDATVDNHTLNQTFKEMRRFAEYHIYPGHIREFSLRDGLTITSLDGNKAYVNRHFNRLTKKTRIWIQGAEIQSPGMKVGNSLVYVLKTAIQRPRKNLFDYLRQSGGHQMLMKLLDKYKLHFQFPFGTTFLAPYDDAFDHIPTKMKIGILSDDVKCKAFLRNHIITRPMCRSRLFQAVGWSSIINSMGKPLTLHQSLYNKQASFVNSASVVTSQQVNEGWVYGISELILPDITQNTFEILQATNKCQTFLNLLKATGHLTALTSLISVQTIFAPSDEAFRKLDPIVYKKLREDRNFLHHVINFHLVPGKYLTEVMYKKNFFRTMAQHNGTTQRLFVNNVMGSIQESRITSSDHLTSNGIVHIVDKVLIPPTKYIKELILHHEGLRVLRKIYEKLDSNLRKIIEDTDGVSTLFLPTDRALRSYFVAVNASSETEAVTNLSEILLSKHLYRAPFVIVADAVSGKEMHLKTGPRSLGMGTTRNETEQFKLVVKVKEDNNNEKIYVIDQYRSVIEESNILVRNAVVHLVDSVFFDFNGVGELNATTVTREWTAIQKQWKNDERQKIDRSEVEIENEKEDGVEQGDEIEKGSESEAEKKSGVKSKEEIQSDSKIEKESKNGSANV